MELEVGSVVGGYVVSRLLGSGGMGAVYLARHPNLPRDVALKVLHPGLLAQPEHRARFEAEAELLSRLDDPGIVDVLDRGQDGDLLWMSMRYVDGPDLAQVLLERGPFAPAVAVDLVAAVGRALDHAHAVGLLHRDVKPANILLKSEPDGTERALLTDFGIAKDLAASRGLTQEGQSPATVAYAAPEQLTGGPLDARADVYALAAVLFELVSGQRAFGAAEQWAVLYSVVDGPVPDLGALRPDLPGLAAVISGGLAKQPAQRPASCAAFTDAARAALVAPVRATPAPPTVIQPAGSGAAAEPARRPVAEPGPGGRGRQVALIGGVLVAVLAVVAAVIALVNSGPGPSSDAATETSSALGSPVAPSPAGTSATDPTASASTALAVGTCLSDDGSPAPCDAAHASEVYATGDCSEAALLAHLGGQVGADVLRTDLLLDQSGDACTVGLPDGPLEQASSDVLLNRDGDRWRRCADSLGREVSCAQPHTQETVYVPIGDGAALDCEARAGGYIGRPFAQLAAQLRVVTAEGCAIEVRGENTLTTSLRRLGSGALPIG